MQVRPVGDASCICIFENDNNGTNGADFDNYIEWNYWVPFITLSTDNNPVNRIVFTTAGSVKLKPDPRPSLPPAEAELVTSHFRGETAEYKDAWLRIFVRLPTEYSFYSPLRQQTFQVEKYAPFVSLNGIEKGADNHYGGWSIWNFGCDSLVQGNDRGGLNGNPNDQIAIWAHIGVKGSLFQVVRVGYSLTVTGRVVPRQ